MVSNKTKTLSLLAQLISKNLLTLLLREQVVLIKLYMSPFPISKVGRIFSAIISKESVIKE
jgi:hypothetical protein